MRLLTAECEGRSQFGKLVEQSFVPCPSSTAKDVLDAIERWDQVHDGLLNASGDSVEAIEPVDSSRWLAPLSNPEKLICIGKNYADHAKEMGMAPPEIPVVFSKFASAIIGPAAKIQLPSISQEVDYEAELVVVIGKQGKDIAESVAMSHVLSLIHI